LDALARRQVGKSHALGEVALEVVGDGQSETPRRRLDRLRQWILVRHGGYRHLAVTAMPMGLPPPIALRTLEERQHLVEGPALRAHLRPLIIVAVVAARVHHAVDGGGAAEDLAAGGGDASSRRMRLRLGAVSPVEQHPTSQDAERDGHPQQNAAVGSPRLEQEHPDLRARTKPVGDHASRGSSADDDIVVVHRHANPRTSLNPPRWKRRKPLVIAPLALATEPRPSRPPVQVAGPIGGGPAPRLRRCAACEASAPRRCDPR
jgi:hypothetical protein